LRTAETVKDVDELVKNLFEKDLGSQFGGVTYVITDENDFVMRIQISNGKRLCAHCNKNHGVFIVQRMYAKEPRKGNATSIIKQLVKHRGVWVQSVLTDASKAFCQKIGCTKDQSSYDFQYFICRTA
jgi:hypothetical protein